MTQLISNDPSSSSLESILNKIPIFLSKTYRMVDNNTHQDIICWSPQGDKFIVKNISRLVAEVFPKHFKHNNFLSFIRQLNMYGFHKLVHSQDGALFKHQHFKRDDPSLLLLIKRKTNSEQPQQQIVALPNRQEKLEQEVRVLRGQHEELQSMIEVLMEQNKTITTQNKHFATMMTQLRQKYRKKLQTMMLLFLFSKKHSNDKEFLYPPHFTHVLEAFQQINNGNPLILMPNQRNHGHALPMITDREHSLFHSDGERSQIGEQFDESEDIFKVLNRSKSHSIAQDDKGEEKQKSELQALEWKNGIPLSPLSNTSRAQRPHKSSQLDDYLHRLQHSDYSQLQLQEQLQE